MNKSVTENGSAFVSNASMTMKSTNEASSQSKPCICKCDNRKSSTSTSENVNRRAFVKRFFAATTALFLISGKAQAEGEDKKNEPSAKEAVCQNCLGSGSVPCELCLGTGFWRALSGNDPRQKYKGVVCPECEGTGTLICPICLGTGEGNIKGLLRRRTVQPGPGRTLQS